MDVKKLVNWIINSNIVNLGRHRWKSYRTFNQNSDDFGRFFGGGNLIKCSNFRATIAGRGVCNWRMSLQLTFTWFVDFPPLISLIILYSISSHLFQWKTHKLFISVNNKSHQTNSAIMWFHFPPSIWFSTLQENKKIIWKSTNLKTHVRTNINHESTLENFNYGFSESHLTEFTLSLFLQTEQFFLWV